VRADWYKRVEGRARCQRHRALRCELPESARGRIGAAVERPQFRDGFVAIGDHQSLAAPHPPEVSSEPGFQFAGSNGRVSGHVVIVTTIGLRSKLLPLFVHRGPFKREVRTPSHVVRPVVDSRTPPSPLMAEDIRPQVQASLGEAYTIERELGGGGMSRTYVALERALSRRVVVKVLSPELAAGVSVERFKREILLAAQLQHPHVVPVFC